MVQSGANILQRARFPENIVYFDHHNNIDVCGHFQVNVHIVYYILKSEYS